jgi:thiosulfate dehydrogenase
MASRSNLRTSSSYPERSGGTFLSFLFGIVFAIAALLLGGWLYLHYGHPPVAAADPAFPMEAQIVHIPLEARIDRELRTPPFGVSEDVFESGAKLYVAHCAGCHGIPGKDAQFAKWMYPAAPQLWKKHAHGNVVGVSDDPAGESFWKIKNGIRLTGMPAYQHLLSPVQMWQIALLLKSADQPLPDPVQKLLTQ